MPAGYLIAQIDVSDADAFEEYRKLVPATITAFGGEYLVRGGKQEQLEGNSNPRTVVLRFDSFEKAHEWYHSSDYEKPKAMRQAASKGNVVLVEGV
ncbi:DUF1330 domain-containing protein [Nisaea acidiphila]|uniref:DUF1330 domain-containing protein n=1 Tax=Nisaea acidiphila TaxID=1862145 RepID=A0A9J7ATH9_9PROT|nr:DUF1330 domain-containing protein [Nisaea acidiphila]UUX49636.1 DUF1330 domain-containing protein [Nisaea acidiphila]